MLSRQLLICLFLSCVSLACHSQQNPFEVNREFTQPALNLSAEEQQWLKEHRRVRVGGGKDWAPFDFFDLNGEYSGIANDFLNEISSISGLQFDVTKDTWTNNLKRLETGDIDLLPAVYSTESRTQTFLFSVPYATTLDYFFAHASLNVTTLDDLNGKTLAIPKSYSSIELISAEFPGIKILQVDTLGEAIDAVVERRADILYDTYSVLQYTLTNDGIANIVPFKSTRLLARPQLHFAAQKHQNTLISIVNKALDAINESDRKQIITRWLANKNEVQAPVLTAQQRRWLNDHPIVFYGAESDWAPFDFVDAKGKHTGLSKDYLDLVARNTGVKFVPVVDSWSALLAKAKNGSLDLLPAIYYSPEYENYLHYSKPYQRMLDYFFLREDVEATSIADLNGKTIAIPAGFTLVQEISAAHPGINIVEVSSVAAAVKRVLDGKADGLADSYTVLNFYLKQNNITSIKPFHSFSTEKDREIFMAATKGNKPLVEIINSVLLQADPAQLQRIKSTWSSFQRSSINAHIALTTEEQRWLTNTPVISIASYENMMPYEGFSDGKHLGISYDFLHLAAQKAGAELVFTRAENLQEALALVEQGHVDAVATSDMQLDEQNYTQVYQSSPLVIIMSDSNNFVQYVEQITSSRVAVVNGAGYIKPFLERFSDLDYHFKDDIQDALTEVSTGKVDVVVAPLSHASYFIAELQLHNLKVVGTTDMQMSLSLAVPTENLPLKTLLDKGLDIISQAEKQAVLNAWAKPRVIEKVNYVLIVQIALPLLLVIVLYIRWNNQLKSEVKRRMEIERQTKMLLNNVPQQIIITDLYGNVLSANHKALADHNITPEELYSVNASDFYVNSDDAKRLQQQLDEVGEVDQMVVPIRWLTGEIRSMMLSVAKTTFKGNPALLTIAVDLTERIAMESELKEAKQRADSANQSKSDFLANMSHEIRTPMNAIIGFTDLLQQQLKDPQLGGFVKTIQSASHSLLTLINDILDLSKVDAGQIKIINEATNIHSLLEEIANVFLMKVKDKNIDLILRIDETIPNSLMLDKARLRQVLFNLVGNAVKFTDCGKVEVIAGFTRHPIQTENINLYVTVKDTGIGIPESEQKNIFKNFYQPEGQNLRQYGGTGLGLTISQRLVQLMGGRIQLESQVNQGSSFTVALSDIQISNQKTVSQLPMLDQRRTLCFDPATVLIVDDIEDNRHLLIEIFKTLSVSTLVAESGEQAIDIVQHHQVDLILMDIRMPGMNGYQAAEIIRQSHSHIPIVALTASVMQDDYERECRENFSAYLRKPVLQQELIAELTKHLPYHYQETQAEKQNTGPLALANSGLWEELSRNFAAECASLQKSNAINQIADYAMKLNAWASSHEEDALIEFSQELKKATEIFDIGKIKLLLVACNNLINKD